MGGLSTGPPGGSDHPNQLTFFMAYSRSFQEGKTVNYTGEPVTSVTVPVVDSFRKDRKTVAVIMAVVRWGGYFEGILTDDTQPVDVVLSNTCEGAFTYEIRGEEVVFIGKGNLASSKYEDMMLSVDLDESKFIIEPNTIALTLNQDVCAYNLRIYPTTEGDEDHNDFLPLIITMTVAAVFLMTTAVFYLYDVMVERRQKVVLDTAQRSTAIVSSIFPKNVRDQILQSPVQGNATKLRSLVNDTKTKRDGIVIGAVDADTGATSRPIADLFPDCTGKFGNLSFYIHASSGLSSHYSLRTKVMFADVEGFTAWSSVREPSQVFTLLEAIYAAFDRVALKRRVFKVETVGDCYVAVSGLPEPRLDHAVTMARFARDCIEEHIVAVKKLESMLGPETGDLRLRVGLHSGPITAGVLRGERSRFQVWFKCKKHTFFPSLKFSLAHHCFLSSAIW